MKKPLALLLVLGLIIALSACTKPLGDSVKGTTPAPNPSEVTTTVAETTTVTELTANSTAELTGVQTTVPTVPTSSKETSATTVSALITRERAIEIALQAAGLSRDSVYDLEAELDRERTGTFWEVDFETREYEYSYDVNAESGAVVKSERERN